MGDHPERSTRRPRGWRWVAVAAGVATLGTLSAWLFLRMQGSDDPSGILSLCPVASGSVKDNFGAPRAGHGHYGNDILADFGEPVLAPFDGVVTHSSTPGGLIVTLRASDGRTIVGKHLSTVTAEGPVQIGDLLGTVGKLAAEESRPHLHFEWHPEGDAMVSDPFPLLQQVCRDLDAA